MQRGLLSVGFFLTAMVQAAELSYLTGGLSWKADYVANLAADGKSLDLNGWVTLTNRSGAGFDHTTLQLVAGTVNRVRQPEPQRAYAMAAPCGGDPLVCIEFVVLGIGEYPEGVDHAGHAAARSFAQVACRSAEGGRGRLWQAAGSL